MSLILEIKSLSKDQQAEVADFVASLKKKSKSQTKWKIREFGFAKGLIKLSSDFDEPLEDFKGYA